MGAILNGLSLSKLRPFGATFFIFSDYARPAIRLSALMELPTIFVFTHDAMGDGEDGPTHQPIEQLASLRAVPGLTLFRPGDANEVVEAYRFIMQLQHRPAVLVLSRQTLPTLDRAKYAPVSGVSHGAYVLADAPGGAPEIILIATGSELSLAAQGVRQTRCRRREGARGVNAVVGRVRTTDTGVSRHCLAARREAARRDRTSVDIRMGALRRGAGARDRHADVRCVRATEGTAADIRIQRRANRCDCKRIVGTQPIVEWEPILRRKE
jgi:Transketolase, pyrimidine binding domain